MAYLNFREFLQEGRSGVLYHVLHRDKINYLLEENTLYATWESYIPRLNKYRMGISMTRNKRLLWYTTKQSPRLYLVFDERKLNYNNKIIPIDADIIALASREGRAYGDLEVGSGREGAEKYMRDASSLAGRKVRSLGDIPGERSRIKKFNKGEDWAEEFVIGDIHNVSSKLIKVVSYYEKYAWNLTQEDIVKWCMQHNVKFENRARKVLAAAEKKPGIRTFDYHRKVSKYDRRR